MHQFHALADDGRLHAIDAMAVRDCKHNGRGEAVEQAFEVLRTVH